EYLPARNLPPLLLPHDLLPLLNEPLKSPLPMTVAMAALAERRGLEKHSSLLTAADELIVAISFELLPDLLQTGDPRLVPETISQFWSHRLSPGPDSLTAYEYFAVRACRPELEPAAAREWCNTQCRA